MWLIVRNFVSSWWIL